MEFKDRIKLIRKKLHLSQTNFARKVGKTMQTIQSWEYGKSEPSEVDKRYIAGIFNVSELWLLTGECCEHEDIWDTSRVYGTSSSECRLLKIPVLLINEIEGYYQNNQVKVYHSVSSSMFGGATNILCVNLGSFAHNSGEDTCMYFDQSINKLSTEGIYLLHVDGMYIIKYVQWTPSSFFMGGILSGEEKLSISKKDIECIKVKGKAIARFTLY